jgi:hypothetical protein
LVTVKQIQIIKIKQGVDFLGQLLVFFWNVKFVHLKTPLLIFLL